MNKILDAAGFDRFVEERCRGFFAMELDRRDPTLSISGVNLSSRKPDSAAFDIELAVTYRVFAAQASDRDGTRS